MEILPVFFYTDPKAKKKKKALAFELKLQSFAISIHISKCSKTRFELNWMKWNEGLPHQWGRGREGKWSLIGISFSHLRANTCGNMKAKLSGLGIEKYLGIPIKRSFGLFGEPASSQFAIWSYKVKVVKNQAPHALFFCGFFYTFLLSKQITLFFMHSLAHALLNTPFFHIHPSIHPCAFIKQNYVNATHPCPIYVFPMVK